MAHRVTPGKTEVTPGRHSYWHTDLEPSFFNGFNLSIVRFTCRNTASNGTNQYIISMFQMHFLNGTLQKPSFRQIHEQTRKQNPPAWHSDLPQGKQKLPQMAIPIGTDTWKCSSSMTVMFAMIGMQNPKGTQTQSISNAIFFFACFFQIDIVRHNLDKLGKENEHP